MEYTLPNGEKVKVNDHVYCSPNWAVRDGTPYSIARIMEFLTDDGTTRGTRARTKEAFTKVRLAWYYRPSDVSDRQVADSRLLLCAIYSEVIAITQLRAKCYVKHKDKIADLAAWKKRPDRFYYNKLFDPFIKREFEVILTSQIRNLPKHIKDNLTSRYDMIVTEKECVVELMDELRTCDTCNRWCPSSDSVQCDSCKSYFHMVCVQPPLMAKPARGYGWSCARCSHKDDDEDGTPGASSKSKSAPGSGRQSRMRTKVTRSATAATAPTKQQEETEDKYFKMWSFRYFGIYTIAEDTLDPEDIIYPRTNTRVGIKFQASVPATGSSLAAPGPDIPERGTDETVEILSAVVRMSEKEVETCKKNLSDKPEVASGVDYLTELIRRFSVAYLQKEPFTTVNLKNPMHLPKWGKEEVRYTDREWNESEKHTFEAAIQEFGPELRSVREQITSRTYPEVVRFFAIWKATKLGEENHRILEARKHGRIATPSKSTSRQGSVGISEEEKSVVNVKTDGRGGATFVCAACRTRQSNVWWKAPKGLSSSVLCDDCGVKWRKYGDLSAKVPKEDTLKQRGATDKREGTPLAPPAKRMKVSPIHTAPTSSVKQIMCQCCKKPGAFGKVIKCIQCCMTIHAGGSAMDTTEAEGWLCEICQNETSLEASLISECVLCPRKFKEDRKKPGPVPRDENDIGFLRARKPTEGQSWTHVLCSLYASETQYTDASRLRLVEGISTIPQNRWQNTCSICNQSGGVYVKCTICPVEYHPSCAWKAGHRFAFEMQGVKAAKRDSTVQVEFRRDTGAMTPVVFCKFHTVDGRRLYDFCDTNERGETAIQVYAKNYKQVPQDNSYGLLRKARRLDVIISGAADKGGLGRAAEISVPTTRCCKCNSGYSPFFHRVDNVDAARDKQAYECHACYFESKASQTPVQQQPNEGPLPMAIEA
ncbi:hypothetical protein M422DRAFT_57796 [Sphaerobolus stellatus SS14]|nr:hypothetical protein M422DRAFT_57796 [Sphaerobolus stellatus SS14]